MSEATGQANEAVEEQHPLVAALAVLVDGYTQSLTALRAMTAALAQADAPAMADAVDAQEAAAAAIAVAEQERVRITQQLFGADVPVSSLLERLPVEEAEEMRRVRHSLLLAIRAVQGEARRAAVTVQAARTVTTRTLGAATARGGYGPAVQRALSTHAPGKDI